MSSNGVTIRPIKRDADRAAIAKIWREVGWIEDEKEGEHLVHFLEDAYGYVAEMRGEAEVSVAAHSGFTRYLERDLSMWGITGVTVSRIARKQGLARALTARTLADGAERGHAVAMLGMFDQGFYDQLGFGTCGYEHRLAFDPSSLVVDGPCAPPFRVSADDYAAAHAAILTMERSHGFSWFPTSGHLRAEMLWTPKGFGLGYYNAEGDALTHYVWGRLKGEHGPFLIYWYAYQNDAQLIELLRLIRALGDQVHLVVMKEPVGVQLQDFLRAPFRERSKTHDSSFEANHTSSAYQQVRILDLEAATAACTGPTDLRIRLELVDPIEAHVPRDARWRGLGGSWVVRLGTSGSSAERCAPDTDTGDMPTVSTSVGGWSRLWFGGTTARALAMQGRLATDRETVERLDGYFNLPAPHPVWDF